MAKIKLSGALAQVSGSIGGLVFKHTKHGDIVVPKGERRRPLSAKQIARHEGMIAAGLFYHGQMADPARQAHYKARAAELGLPVSAFVMGGYMSHGTKFADMEAPRPPAEADTAGRDGSDIE